MFMLVCANAWAILSSKCVWWCVVVHGLFYHQNVYSGVWFYVAHGYVLSLTALCMVVYGVFCPCFITEKHVYGAIYFPKLI